MNRSGFSFESVHAFYVWVAYGLTLMAMGGEVLLLLRRRRAQRDDTDD